MAKVLDPVAYYRAAHWFYRHRVPVLPRVLKVLGELIFHCEIPFDAEIGEGLQVAHRGFGIVVHRRAVIGCNCVISPCVTIGGRSGKYEVPRLGNDVFVSFGARILGDVTIGDGVIVGANAVVTHSVPPNSVVAGVPARVIRQNACSSDHIGPSKASFAELTANLEQVRNQRDEKRIQILLLIQSLDLGGSENQCLETALKLSAEGYSVGIGCFRDTGPLKSRAIQAGIPVTGFPVKNLLRPMAIWQMIRLFSFLRKNRVRVVQSNDLYTNLFAIPIARLAKVPVVIASQRDLSHWWWYTPVRRKILRKIQGLSTWLVVNSKAIRADLIEKDRFNPRKIRVVYNGVDAERFISVHPIAREQVPGVSSGDRLIVMVANMHLPVKGHPDLIAAARSVCRQHPEARFILIGDGEMRSEFEKQVRSVGLQDAVLFIGHRTNIPEILAACDIGVLASRAEGMPNAVLEYMAAGLATVATSVGGVPEIIEDEVNGLLVPAKNPSALSRAICQLLEDVDLRKRLGEAARDSVMEKFGLANVVRNLEQLYDLPSTVRFVERQQQQEVVVE